MQYRAVSSMSRQKIMDGLSSGREDAVAEALLSATYHDPDWRWVQARCLDLLSSGSHATRALAITCLGHLARIHGVLDTQIVLPALRGADKDPALPGRVRDALGDMEMFLSRG